MILQEENNHITFTAEDIRKYHEGKLTPGQMHALERASLEDPFLSDALEGYAVEEVKVPADLNELKDRLRDLLENKSKVISMAAPAKPFNWLRVAAMIVAIGGAGLLVYNLGIKTSNKENTIAQDLKVAETDTPQAATVPAPDTAVSGQSTPAVPLATQTEAPAGSKQNALAAKQLAEKSAQVKREAEASAKAETATIAGNDEAKAKLRANTVAPSESKSIAIPDDSNRADSLMKRLPGMEIAKENKAKDIRLHGYTNPDKNLPANNGYTSQNRNTASYEANNNQQNPKLRRQLSMQPATNIFRGKITDEQNNPLPFANITNLIDDIGTYADAQGNFVLTSPDSVMNVQVRSLGFESNQTQLQNGLAINKVSLKDDNSIPPIVLSNKKVNARFRQGNMILEEPEPADGWTKYDSYLANNLKLPDSYKTKPQESGEVELSFEVNSIGEPINIKVEKSLCEVCDKEAIRLLKDGPKWKRKAKKGKRTTITIPF
ncbi:carboxypeptidase-like regulatory domain-containing protein [Terrimonas sp. NA20]|uniref:Carboxypeptidase-like regulatory domain-containing protein n=1 Tax=Terrimonas ginsenosidimutans TaxID=2908004 RepID=A0ABS9KY48_9BACT|nr:carboxypeptidase-like regulatory domain-containing protein [Terrimonas ginsenosidimutans]MCG2617302.1 carboxypeptidase-like regulatory domain-containing protein [Terrimonas ginsenosidimutans]